MSTDRAANIIAKSLSGEEVELLFVFGREHVMPTEEYTEVFRSLLSLRLIEVMGGGSKAIISHFGREVLAQTNPFDGHP